MVNFDQYIRLLVAKIFLAGQICRTFTLWARGPKSTLLIKIFDLDPEKFFFLYIGKGINGKYSILGSLDHFLEGS